MIFSRTKRAFEVKWKTFFLVSQVLSFRLKKQTSKNVADTAFKVYSWKACQPRNFIQVNQAWMQNNEYKFPQKYPNSVLLYFQIVTITIGLWISNGYQQPLSCAILLDMFEKFFQKQHLEYLESFQRLSKKIYFILGLNIFYYLPYIVTGDNGWSLDTTLNLHNNPQQIMTDIAQTMNW